MFPVTLKISKLMPYQDPVKQKEAKRQWYLRNKEKSLESARKNKQRDIEWFKSIKRTKCCAVCGETKFELLDFHHIDPSTKVASVADILGRKGRNKVIEEMNKCRVLCKKCHTDHHDSLGNSHQKRDPKTGKFINDE